MVGHAHTMLPYTSHTLTHGGVTHNLGVAGALWYYHTRVVMNGDRSGGAVAKVRAFEHNSGKSTGLDARGLAVITNEAAVHQRRRRIAPVQGHGGHNGRVISVHAQQGRI